MNNTEEQIDLVLEGFDFKAAQVVMETIFALEGKKRMEVPSIDELIRIAKNCLEQADQKNGIFEFGMFEAIKEGEIFELRLVPVKSNPLSHLFN